MLAWSGSRLEIGLRLANLIEAAIDLRDRDFQPSVRDSSKPLVEHGRSEASPSHPERDVAERAEIGNCPLVG